MCEHVCVRWCAYDCVNICESDWVYMNVFVCVCKSKTLPYECMNVCDNVIVNIYV